jgi:hypothetical protein
MCFAYEDRCQSVLQDFKEHITQSVRIQYWRQINCTTKIKSCIIPVTKRGTRVVLDT